MRREENYLLLSYRDMPDVDFICQCETGMRVKVSVKDRNNIYFLSAGTLYGVAERFVFIFENVSASFRETEELLKAVNWYRSFKGLYRMEVLCL